MQVTTWSALELALMNIIKECIYEVGEKVNDKMRYYIQTDVYTGQNVEYEPTYEFLESVSTSSVRLEGKSAVVEVYADTDKIHYKPDFTHGSGHNDKPYWHMQDISSILPEILAYNLSGNFFGSGQWYQRRRNYYDDTIKSLNEGGLLKSWFVSALKKRGIDAK